LTDDDPTPALPPDDAAARRWRNTIGRSARTPYVGDPVPDRLRLPATTPGSPRTAGGDGRDGFRGPQVCAIVGITYRQLDYWARTDLLRPSLEERRGMGTQRLYSFEDVVHLAILKKLLDEGVSLQKAKQAIAALREHPLDDSSSLVLGARQTLIRQDADLVDLLHSGQGMLSIVPLRGVIAEVRQAIADLYERAPVPPPEDELRPAGAS
jgi:DNA-binding transcriptional MerR regulator